MLWSSVKGVDWDQMTKRTSPALFKQLNDGIIRIREEIRVLMRFNELRQTLTLRMSNVAAALRDAESETPVADSPAHNRITDSYQFNCFLGDIYSTLVARLHHTHPFERD